MMTLEFSADIDLVVFDDGGGINPEPAWVSILVATPAIRATDQLQIVQILQILQGRHLVHLLHLLQKLPQLQKLQKLHKPLGLQELRLR
jgi:hypothetical protein